MAKKYGFCIMKMSVIIEVESEGIRLRYDNDHNLVFQKYRTFFDTNSFGIYLSGNGACFKSFIFAPKPEYQPLKFYMTTPLILGNK